jgi:hypothetical protein
MSEGLRWCGIGRCSKRKRLASGTRCLAAAGDCPFRFTFLYTFQKPFRHWKGRVSCGMCCRCLSHHDFGVPGLSFGRLIQPPAALCVCVTVLVARFARSTNPLLGRSRPRFRSHKAAGATAPAPRPRSRLRPLAAARPAGRVKSPTMFLFCGCWCFSGVAHAPADHGPMGP